MYMHQSGVNFKGTPNDFFQLASYLLLLLLLLPLPADFTGHVRTSEQSELQGNSQRLLPAGSELCSAERAAAG
jgi:hypothetical protein